MRLSSSSHLNLTFMECHHIPVGYAQAWPIAQRMWPSISRHSNNPSQHIPFLRGCGQAVPITKIPWFLTYSIICVRQISLKKIIFDKHDSCINFEKIIHFILCCIRVVFSRRWMARWKHCGRRLFRTCIISWFIKWTAHQKEWNEIEWIEKWFLLINTHTKHHTQNGKI